MLKIKNLCVNYGDLPVYDNFSLTVGEGVTCILGESGCGKTTLLNAVANLVPYRGEITPVSVSYVFQTPRLVPQMTVINNLVLTGADRDSAAYMLQRTGLGDKINAYPNELSGGEKQRVSLCRAFLKKAQLILLDEPFSSLDLRNKLSVMELFVSLLKDEGRSALFVTHDVDEAVFLADRIVVLRGGTCIADFDNDNKLSYGANSPVREKIISSLIGNLKSK